MTSVNFGSINLCSLRIELYRLFCALWLESRVVVFMEMSVMCRLSEVFIKQRELADRQDLLGYFNYGNVWLT